MMNRDQNESRVPEAHEITVNNMNAQQHTSPAPRSFAFRGAFLEQFPPLRRSLITNQFCGAVRAGAKTADEVLAGVAQDARRRIADGRADNEARNVQRLLFSALEDKEAAEFAAFILSREGLPEREKNRLRAMDRQSYFERHMAEKPPTEKQLALLRELGSYVAPANRLAASNAIDRLLRREGER